MDSTTDALLADLTEPQAEAVRHTDGPLLVLAGAGAGKTRVITRRAAYLAATVTSPANVLAITFTNKAANEMRERVEALGVGRGMTLCTFHSLAARLLRIHHDRASLPADFTIFDVPDQRRVVKDAVARADLSADNWPPARVLGIISNAKNAMVTAELFEEQAHDWSLRTIARIYTAYEAVLAEQHGLDFDDLLLKLALVLRDDADLRARLEQRFTHVLIDEYQDTNSAQYDIARLITQQNRNLCATGDPDQSIYGWRGADIRNILHFEKDFPDATVVRLEQNYRSTKRILAAASAVIEHNISRKEKTLWTENPEGQPVRVVTTEDAEKEAELIATELRQRRDCGEPLAEAAVFYRVNAMTRAVEEALIRAGVPYQVARGTEFYNRKEIKDVLAYVRVLLNPHDEVSLTRILGMTRGIGKTTIDRLVAHTRATDRTLIDALHAPRDVPRLGKAALDRVAGLMQILDSMAPLNEERPRHALEQVLLRSGLQAELNALSEHDPEPAQNVSELLNATATFENNEPEGTLRDWLEQTALMSDVDTVDERQDCVTLMTLHAAKGLEFPIVYIIGLEDTMLPFVRLGADDDCDLEEERRLCFVGMTRCKRELTLMHARYRMMRGAAERKVPSQFLDELPREQVEWIELGNETNGRSRSAAQRGDLPHDIEQWTQGALVRHPEYDLGQIKWIRQNGAHVSVTVYFQCGLEKTFDLRYADLTRVDYDEIG